jgi:putative endonuclease
MSRNKSKGRRGERLAADFLIRAGYQILHYNLRLGKKEVDLVAKDGNEWVFVEVKTRRAGGVYTPEADLTPTKQRHLFEAADLFIQRHEIYRDPLRFDFVAVEISPAGNHQITHYPDAFRRDSTLPDQH